MHFIQNAWFSHNWFMLFLLMAACLSVVSYINNRRRLYRYSSLTFIGMAVILFFIYLLPEIRHSLSDPNQWFSLDVGKSSEEKISVFSKIIDCIFSVLKNKIGGR